MISVNFLVAAATRRHCRSREVFFGGQLMLLASAERVAQLARSRLAAMAFCAIRVQFFFYLLFNVYAQNLK